MDAVHVGGSPSNPNESRWLNSDSLSQCQILKSCPRSRLQQKNERRSLRKQYAAWVKRLG